MSIPELPIDSWLETLRLDAYAIPAAEQFQRISCYPLPREQPCFQFVPQMVVVFQQLVERDKERNLKRERVIRSSFEFGVFYGARLHAIELIHYFVNILASWVAVIGIADQRQSKPVDYLLHPVRVV